MSEIRMTSKIVDVVLVNIVDVLISWVIPNIDMIDNNHATD